MKQKYTLAHDRAFRLLVRLSNETNVKMRDIAADLVHEHDACAETLPDAESRQGLSPLP